MTLQQLQQDVDLETVLAAWESATQRLQSTHHTLRTEVRRLSDELEIKNRELARKNRLADLGQISAHVAHEVRNSLVPITLYVSLLQRRCRADAGVSEVLEKIDCGLLAMEATVNDLLHFSADRDPQRRSFDLRGLVDGVCESLAPQLAAQKISTEIDIAQTTQCFADPDMLRRLLLNLILNAIDVMPEGGELVVTGEADAAGMELEVADSGPGVAESVKNKLFDPFFTTKSGGTGLGLSIVHRIAEAHGGSISVANCPEGGAAFTLRVPSQLRKAAA